MSNGFHAMLQIQGAMNSQQIQAGIYKAQLRSLHMMDYLIIQIGTMHNTLFEQGQYVYFGGCVV